MVLLAVDDSLVVALAHVLGVFGSVLGARLVFTATMPLATVLGLGPISLRRRVCSSTQVGVDTALSAAFLGVLPVLAIVESSVVFLSVQARLLLIIISLLLCASFGFGFISGTLSSSTVLGPVWCHVLHVDS